MRGRDEVKNPWFLAFANFYGVNIPTVSGFKLPVVCLTSYKIPECTQLPLISQYEPDLTVIICTCEIIYILEYE